MAFSIQEVKSTFFISKYPLIFSLSNNMAVSTIHLIDIKKVVSDKYFGMLYIIKFISQVLNNG